MADDEEGFLDKLRTPMLVVSVIALGAGGYYFLANRKSEPAKPKAPPMMMLSMPPLPPLPTPPPPPPPPQPKNEPPPEETKQEMVEQAPVEQNEPPPEDKPADEPPPMGTALQGNGPPDGFGLSGSGGGGMIGGTGTGGGGGRRGGSKFGWYAGQVQTRIAEALRENKRTRSASLSLQVRIWADSNGRITRASLADSTGDAAVDTALKDEVLTGLKLQEPPPADMPMPIVMRISARRPG
ncbi:MAG: TonB C-terminal domain-containing protein [Roseimicrobium sp.]